MTAIRLSRLSTAFIRYALSVMLLAASGRTMFRVSAFAAKIGAAAM
jgi:hypothetical protein